MKYFAIVIILFSSGKIFSQDIAELRQDAEQGKTSAMLKLAEYYDLGIKVPITPDSALFWYKKAADAGSAKGQYVYGNMLTAEIFNPSKFRSGVDYLKKSADQDFHPALARLRGIYAKSEYGEVQKSEISKYYSLSKALEYSEKAANLGNVQEAIWTARAYAEGKGVKKDHEKAKKYFRMAAVEKGHNVARNSYAEFLLNNKPDKQELHQAIRMLRLVEESPIANVEQETKADILLHEADMRLKKTQNLMYQASPLLHPANFSHIIRE